MLFDPKWEVKTDALSIDSLVTWLEKQPADKEYDFMSIDTCLMANYLSGIGISHGSQVYVDIFGSEAAYGRIAARCPWTYGAALQRAREYIGR